MIPKNGERVWPPWLSDLASSHTAPGVSSPGPSRLLQITIGEGRDVLEVKGLQRIGSSVEVRNNLSEETGSVV